MVHKILENFSDQAEEVIKKLTAKQDLLDVMLDIEDYFDNNNLYVFDNWFKGELVNGPLVKKYWIEVTFKYPYHHMPDPEGGLRLTQHGTKIQYEKTFQMVPVPIQSPDDYEPGTKKPRMKKEKVWLIHMKIPRRFVETLDPEMLDIYDEEVEDTDIDNAEDQMAQGQAPGLEMNT
jgi:hypothetical protein